MTEPTPEQTEAVTKALHRVHLSLQLAALEVFKVENNPINQERFRLANLESKTPDGKKRDLALSRQLNDISAIAVRAYVDLYSKALGLGNDGP